MPKNNIVRFYSPNITIRGGMGGRRWKKINLRSYSCSLCWNLPKVTQIYSKLPKVTQRYPELPKVLAFYVKNYNFLFVGHKKLEHLKNLEPFEIHPIIFPTIIAWPIKLGVAILPEMFPSRPSRKMSDSVGQKTYSKFPTLPQKNEWESHSL